MLSIAYAIELNIMLIAAQNHCVILVIAGISTYRPKLFCSAIPPSGPNRPAKKTPSTESRSSSSLTSRPLLFQLDSYVSSFAQDSPVHLRRRTDAGHPLF